MFHRRGINKFDQVHHKQRKNEKKIITSDSELKQELSKCMMYPSLETEMEVHREKKDSTFDLKRMP